MKTIMKATTLLILSFLLLAACGEAAVEPVVDPLPTETAEPEPTETPEPIEEREETEMEAEIPAELQDLADKMLADLAERAAISRDAITVAEVESVTWADGSLGCPEPDMGYTMALEPGYRLILIVDGREFHYHTRGTVDFIYCEDPPGNGTVPDM